MNDLEVAELQQVIYDPDTGDLFVKMKITDPVIKQQILRNSWGNNLNVKLVVENADI